ncbi:MAG: exosortase C-terminal domain/associated protein EpsI, partial [Gammaproteobacteria bacterium]
RAAIGGILVASLAVIALYWPGFSSLVAVWSSTVAYRFLFLVPLLFLYFLWLRWPDVAALRPQPTALGLAYAAPFGLLWLFAQATQLSLGAQVAAIGMLQAVFLTVLGWAVVRRLLFPLLLLWLMVPVGDLLTPALIELTTGLTIGLLKVAGLPAVADGNLLVAGGARYAIIRECTGLDFLLGNLLVSLVFANLLFRHSGKRIAYVVAGIVVAILANNFRTTSVILITDAGYDLARDHATYGWCVFLVAMLLQMAVGLRFRDDPHEPDGEVPAAVPGGQASAAQVAAAVCGIVAVAALAPAYVRFALDQEPTPVAVQLCLASTSPSVSATSGDAEAWRPQFPAADGHLLRTIDAGNRPIDVYVAYYWRQGPGRKLIAWDNRLHDGKQWRYMASGRDTATLAGTPLAVGTERLSNAAGGRRLVWYWYWVDGHFVDRPWQVKLRQAQAELFGGERRSALVALSTGDAPGEDAGATRAALQAGLDQLAQIPGLLNDAAREIPGRGCLHD